MEMKEKREWNREERGTRKWRKKKWRRGKEGEMGWRKRRRKIYGRKRRKKRPGGSRREGEGEEAERKTKRTRI